VRRRPLLVVQGLDHPAPSSTSSPVPRRFDPRAHLNCSGAEGSRTLDLLNAMHLTPCPGRPRASASVRHTTSFVPVVRTVANVRGSRVSHNSAAHIRHAEGHSLSIPMLRVLLDPARCGTTFAVGCPRVPALWRADAADREHRGPDRHPQDSHPPRAPDRHPATSAAAARPARRLT
jgi:hypothetical protein